MTDTTAPNPDAITFFWRPGCGFCMMLDRRLSKLGVRMDKRNIWDDADAAATVRSHAGGNETVPTVVVGDVAMVNPSASEVLDTIRAEAPHLEPDDPGGSGCLLDRVLGR